MRNYTIFDLFVRNLTIANEKTAIVAGSDRISFGQLHDQAAHLATD